MKDRPTGVIRTLMGIVSAGRHRGHRYVCTRTIGRFYLCITAVSVSILELPSTNAVIEISWLDVVYVAILLLVLILTSFSHG